MFSFEIGETLVRTFCVLFLYYLGPLFSSSSLIHFLTYQKRNQRGSRVF